MGEQIMHLGFGGNVCREKIPLRISSHRLEDDIKIVPKKRDWRLWTGFVFLSKRHSDRLL